jgi:hypothetical protein
MLQHGDHAMTSTTTFQPKRRTARDDWYSTYSRVRTETNRCGYAGADFLGGRARVYIDRTIKWPRGVSVYWADTWWLWKRADLIRQLLIVETTRRSITKQSDPSARDRAAKEARRTLRELRWFSTAATRRLP